MGAAMQGLRGSIRWVPYVGQVSLLAVVYFAAAKGSLVLAIPPGYATAVWPPSGIALAAVMLLGNRVWPGIWLGAALVVFGFWPRLILDFIDVASQAYLGRFTMVAEVLR